MLARKHALLWQAERALAGEDGSRAGALAEEALAIDPDSALARVGLVAEQLQRGELVEPFGIDGRIHSPYAYWLVVTQHSRHRPEVCQFADWVKEQGALTRAAVGELVQPAGASEAD